MTDLRVRDLYVYPLKSGAGLRVDAVTLDARGFVGDRRWMLIDAEGKFLTQRELPRLALLRAGLADAALQLDAPGMPTLVIPEPDAAASTATAAAVAAATATITTVTATTAAVAATTAAAAAGGAASTAVSVPVPAPTPARVRIWDDACDALEGDPDAARPWLRRFLGLDARLVFAPPGMPRLVDRAYADGDEHVAFTDGFPLLLIGQASLDGLNARLEAKGSPALPMNRFRPNIVIDGGDAHAEDGWRRLAIGAPDRPLRLDIVKPCARCVITTIEQTTGVAGKEPLTTLASYRRRGGKVFFGQNVIHRDAGILRVGDPVRIIEEMTT
jgi:uncharacterized protein YcbX